MRESEYLGLKIIEDNDKPSWTGEFDYNFEKVDTAVGEMSSSTSSIIGTLETRIDNLENTTATHDTRIGVNTSSIAALNMDYVSFKTNQQAVNESDDGRLDVLESNSLIIGTDMSNLKKEMERTSSIVAVAEQKVDVMETEVNRISSGLVTVQGNVNQLENDFDGLETTVNGFDNRITTAENNASNASVMAQNALNTANSKISSLNKISIKSSQKTLQILTNGSVTLTFTNMFETKLLPGLIKASYDFDVNNSQVTLFLLASYGNYIFVIFPRSKITAGNTIPCYMIVSLIDGSTPATLNFPVDANALFNTPYILKVTE